MIAITGSTGALGGLVTKAVAGSDFRLDLRLLVRGVRRLVAVPGPQAVRWWT